MYGSESNAAGNRYKFSVVAAADWSRDLHLKQAIKYGRRLSYYRKKMRWAGAKKEFFEGTEK